MKGHNEDTIMYFFTNIYISSSSSSSCRAASTDIPDHLSPLLPHHSSPPACLQVYILCLHIAAVCKFELVVLLLLGHMRGSIVVHH